MSNFSPLGGFSSYQNSVPQQASTKSLPEGQEDKNVTSAREVDNSSKTSNKKIQGRTIGNPQLSDKAKAYYEKLQKKFHNTDMILVSKDQKENAKAMAGSFANPHKMVVLIDEEKVERMAEDEDYRKKFESVIENAASGMSQLTNSLQASGANIKGVGMQVDDNGTASYFAVLEKSSAAQKERIEKHLEESRAQRKEDAKKAAKKEFDEKIHSKDPKDTKADFEPTETVMISAGSIEELLQKVKDQQMAWRSDEVQTEAEKQVGQKIDYSV